MDDVGALARDLDRVGGERLQEGRQGRVTFGDDGLQGHDARVVVTGGDGVGLFGREGCDGRAQAEQGCTEGEAEGAAPAGDAGCVSWCVQGLAHRHHQKKKRPLG